MTTETGKHGRPANGNRGRLGMARAGRELAFFIHRWILRRRYLVARAQPFDLEIKVHADDVIGRHLYKYGSHDAELTAFLQRHVEIRPGDVIFDIGANIGWYSLVLDRVAPAGADIYAFEPEPENFALLVENIARNGAGKVHPVEKGISDSEGVLKLHLCPKGNRGRHSLLPINAGGAIDVPVVSLDTFWAEQHLGARVLRLLKIDVEGYEYIAFRGASAALSRCRAVLAEYSPAYMKKAGLEPVGVLELLRNSGFTPYVVRGMEKVPANMVELANGERHVDLFWERAP